MKLKVVSGRIEELDGEALVVFASQYSRITDRLLKNLNEASGGQLSALLDRGEFCGKEGEIAELFQPTGFTAGRVVLAGLGDRRKIAADSFRKASGIVSRCSGLDNSSSAVFCYDKTAPAEIVQAVVEGYLLGSYRLLEFKSDTSESKKSSMNTITFAATERKNMRRIEKAVERGQIIAEGQMLVRDLAARPANYLTPKMLAQKATDLGRQYKFSTSVLDEKEIKSEKMGALLSVSRGSKEPPRFIIMRHNGGRKGQAPVVLVGKGVTFDTGGISLKVALAMHEMKGDMTGAAVVLSTMVTAARLKLGLNLVGLIPTVENMPSGDATRPGDIVTSRKGLTIEVINTDAEGRLILADGLDYANKFKPQAVIDVATLTGATLYSLGYEGAPIFGNNRSLIKGLEKASAVTSERVWEFPMWEEYGLAMKSDIADLVNSGGRDAGTCKAAAFLEKFIGDWPWAHIDIAYVDIETKGRPYLPKGATGIGLRLLVELLSSWKKPGK